MAQVSSGKNSKQDYATPDPVIEGLVRRYGKQIVFDLAAEPHNKKHSRYFAPPDKVRFAADNVRLPATLKTLSPPLPVRVPVALRYKVPPIPENAAL